MAPHYENPATRERAAARAAGCVRALFKRAGGRGQGARLLARPDVVYSPVSGPAGPRIWLASPIKTVIYVVFRERAQLRAAAAMDFRAKTICIDYRRPAPGGG